MSRFLLYIVQLLLAPANGWADISDASADRRKLMSCWFWPMLTVSCLSVFVQKAYHSDLAWVWLLEKALVQFVAFATTYYIAGFFFSLFLLRNISTALDWNRIHIYFVMTLSLLSLMQLVINCVPFSPVLVLLPMYVIVVMRMSARFMSVIRARIGQYMLLSLCAIFIPPYVIMFLFSQLIGAE